jgi:hypothetical protein
VIVVVDHNGDVRTMLSARLGARVKIIANPAKRDLASARNAAVALSTGDPSVFSADDAVARKHWLVGRP